jgi:F-type H+-transporting ATPase subunit b
MAALYVLGLPDSIAQEETTETTEEHGAEEEHNPILPEADELIFGSIAFLLVFWVLARKAYPAIRKGLRERQEKIQGDLEAAEQAKAEGERSQEQYRQQLQEARTEANRIIEEARKTAEQTRKDILTKAQDEAQQIVRRAQEEIGGERERAMQSLRGDLAAASVDLAARVIGESMDRERQLRLVDQYIDEVSGMASNGKGNGNGSGG